jgi:hypothetical protein
MLSMKVYAESDAHGNVKFELPVGTHNTRYEVIVVLQPVAVPVAQAEQSEADEANARKRREELGWPPGFFEMTAGALADVNLERPEQLPLQEREEFDTP